MSDELSIHEAVDLAERYVTRIAKPFERVRDVLRASIEAQAKYDYAQKELGYLNATIYNTDQARMEKERAFEDYNKKVTAETLELANEMTALRDQVDAARNEAQQQMNEARAAAAKVVADAKAETAGALAGLQAEIAGLETRKAALEDAIGALKAGVAALGGGR
jgi:lysozyme family protein